VTTKTCAAVVCCDRPAQPIHWRLRAKIISAIQELSASVNILASAAAMQVGPLLYGMDRHSHSLVPISLLLRRSVCAVCLSVSFGPPQIETQHIITG